MLFRSGVYLSGTSLSLSASLDSGYTFDGWFNGSTKVSSNSDFTYITTASAVTLTAKATKNTYQTTVSLEKDGVSWTSGAPTITIGSSSETAVSNGSSLPNGTYKIYADGVDTGKTITVNDSVVSTTLSYFTLTTAKESGIASVSSGGVYLSEIGRAHV